MSRPKLRCAIYTRKSSDEGLDQEFNSLDAQHEACAAYIASQRHEGWTAVRQRYDDGGISGGTLERPGLQRLLAEIEAGRVNMVVVYKIDRLTRSLADFAKLVERLEAAGCSFVSVTQAFNTSSSMGRLTLNVLLSFAQFEREVTAERIRDKIAASKKKGLWMGGVPPLGYDPHPDPNRRELVINAAEAEVVRRLFALHAEHGCLAIVTREAARLGLRSKRHEFRSGRSQGGTALSRGQIHKILTNPVYLGRIRHKDKTWPGLHDAIIDEALWEEVQRRLQSASAKRRGSPAGTAPSGPASLKGKFRDEAGDLLTPTHTQKRGRRIRYYISNRLVSGGPDPQAWRLPATAFEPAIANAIAAHLRDHAQRHATLACGDATASAAASQAMQHLAERIDEGGIGVAAQLLASGRIARQSVRLDLDRAALAAAAGLDATSLAEDLLATEQPFACHRRGIETRIVAGDSMPRPDAVLLRGLRNAHRWAEALKAGRSLREIASAEGFSDRYIARVVPLAGLSPCIQTAIVAGNQPPDLTLERLVRMRLPLAWPDQERILGIIR